MKTLIINGSARKEGNTQVLIQTVAETLKQEGIESEDIHIGNKVKGCMACMKCWETKDKKCVINDDPINEIIPKIEESDALVLASPVYNANVTSSMQAFIERVSFLSFANDHLFQRKVGAGIIAVRRTGGMHAFNTLNSFFLISQMIVVGSSYWNVAYGNESGEITQDEEGLQTMNNMAKNMAWLLKSIDAAKSTVKQPETIKDAYTNFIR